MELDEDGLVFHPSLEMGTDHGFLTLIEGLVNDIYNTAKLIPRLAKGRMSYKVSPGLPGLGGGFLAPAAFLTQQRPVIDTVNAGGSECGEEPEGVIRSEQWSLPQGTFPDLLPATR